MKQFLFFVSRNFLWVSQIFHTQVSISCFMKFTKNSATRKIKISRFFRKIIFRNVFAATLMTIPPPRPLPSPTNSCFFTLEGQIFLQWVSCQQYMGANLLPLCCTYWIRNLTDKWFVIVVCLLETYCSSTMAERGGAGWYHQTWSPWWT